MKEDIARDWMNRWERTRAKGRLLYTLIVCIKVLVVPILMFSIMEYSLNELTIEKTLNHIIFWGIIGLVIGFFMWSFKERNYHNYQWDIRKELASQVKSDM